MIWINKQLPLRADDSMEFENVRKLRLLYLLVTCDAIACFLYTLLGIFSGHLVFTILNIGATVALISIFFLLYFQKIRLALFSLITFGSFYVFLYVFYFADIGIEYYIISGIITLSFVFGNKTYAQLFLFLLLCSLLLLIQKLDHFFADHVSSFNHEVTVWVKYPNIVFCIFLIYMTIRQYHIDLEKSLTIITSQNKDLAEKNTQIVQQKVSLENSNHTKNKILSILAHDLRGPVGTLKGALYLLINKTLNEKERDNLLQKLYDSTLHTADFLDLLLLWGKNQFEGTQVHISDFDLVKLTDGIVSLLDDQAQMKAIQIKRLYSGEILVHSDKDLIHTSIRNLLNNAIKFTPERGEIKLSIVSGKDNLSIIIQDKGTGIPQENLPRLFSMETVTKVGTMGEKGTGLGLVLVKECVEKCRGQLKWIPNLTLGLLLLFHCPTGSYKFYPLNRITQMEWDKFWLCSVI
jgi:signal transduction histidine kinase